MLVLQFVLRNEGINDTFTLSATSDNPDDVSVTVVPQMVFLTGKEQVQGNLTFMARDETKTGTIR